MTFAEIISLAIGAILVNNVLLSQFLGICSFVGVSKKRSSALGMGVAVLFVLILSSLVTWLLYNLVLKPLNVTFLSTIVFILVIATLVQFVEMVIKKYLPGLYKVLGIYLPLITTNCAILGVANFVNVGQNYDLVQTLVYAISIGLGYILVMFIFSGIREKIETAPIPKPFKGVAIAFIIAGFMAMAFAGFSGIA
ncbi:MAG: RnfABCDGE type electron transport complex subunit A [Erysipelotrichaceae bacterium]|nr:RnfABCDGE type electron transport complex subunit A [Erysipelotrichaceae bacterium]